MIRWWPLGILLSVCLCRLVAARVIDENNLVAIQEGQTAAGFVIEDPHRGTMAIIMSCAVTMALCIWTALHLNIPATHESTARIWLRNLYWTLLGLLAPELVVYQAWRQWIAANALKRMVNRCQEADSEKGEKRLKRMKAKFAIKRKGDSIKHEFDRSDTSHSGSHHDTTWTIVHGFYGVMGGFTFDAETVAACGIEPAVPLTLTPRGVALLAQCGVAPFIPVSDVEDKSKADGMAKLLVCIQAGYMCIQMIARKVERLAITQLEFNTLGHVVCAIFIYILWWNKPWTIYSATTLHGDWTAAICAYMWMSSKISAHDNHLDIPVWRIFAKTSEQPEFERLRSIAQPPIPTIIEPAPPEFVLPTPLPRRSTDTLGRPAVVQDNWRKYAAAYLSPIVDSFRAQLSPQSAIARTLSQETSFSAPPPSSPVDRQALNVMPSDDSENAFTRYRLAMEAMDRFPVLGARVREATDRTEDAPGLFTTEELLVPVMSNWPRDSVLVSNVRGVVMGMALWFASMAFGAVHAAAWHDYFPSQIEAWMWRASALYIIWSGLLWLSINCLGMISNRFDHFWDAILAGRASWMTYAFLAVVCTLCGVAYGFARLFLVIESWVSLRELPKNAYFTPTWEPWIPHI